MDPIEPVVSREIYGMPVFVTLTVADLDRTVDWYVNGLGFISLFTMPGPDGGPALVHLRRGGGLVEGPADTPWNTRDVRATDPDGYVVVFTARRPVDEQDERFTAMMQEQARLQLGR
ncbi:MAG TPA: hypothetical protein VFC00_17100 [Micromonosporaceae bacterium]|nr:hypothetical protein [Micromonosporaceae bacterium]